MDNGKLLKIQNDLKSKPKAVLAAARRGSLPELVGLSNLWPQITRSIRPDEALDAFLSHLKRDQVPTNAAAEAAFAASANRAFQSLVGISKADPSNEANRALTPRILEAWPGIHDWSLYLFKTRVEALQRDDPRRKNTIYMLSAVWYTISNHDPLRVAMVNTPQTLEIAAQLWIEEEDSKVVSQTSSPFGTCLLYSLLEDASFNSLQRVHKATGRKSALVAKLAISNIKSAVNRPRLDGSHLMIHLELISRISRYANHPFRHALLSANVIWVVTSVLVKLGDALNSTLDLTLIDAMVSCFVYLYNCLESTDGFTWVSQAIRAGLLQAFCDCSPRFGVIHKDDLDMILSIFRNILPRYLVYRSVLESIDHAMKKVDCDPYRKRINSSVAKNTWYDFRQLAEERFVVTWQATALKDSRLTCDNVKCQKVGTKDDMRACSACLHTYYCSKECQAIAWKDGDHKTMCKMKQQERLEGKSEAISKKDAKFFHDLTLRDAIKHLPHLRGIAKKEYPNLGYHDLVVKIDYTVNPPNFKLVPLTGYNTGRTSGTANAEARNVALIEKVKQDREKYSLIESLIASGEGKTCVLTVGTGEFWSSDEGMIGGGRVAGVEDSDVEAEGGTGTAIDDVDIFRARRALNTLLKNMGEKPAF